MALPKLTADVSIHQSKDNRVRGQAAATKAYFDKPVEDIKEYLNDVLTAAIDAGYTSKTTSNITYYIRTDGSDSNDGSADDAEHAFLTIQHAIDILPQTINHTVTINVAAGTYAETVTINGFSGKGSLNLLGDTVVSTSYTVTRIIVQNCNISVLVRGFNATLSPGPTFAATNCANCTFNYCNTVQSSAGAAGFTFSNTSGAVTNSVISNRNIAIQASYSKVFSDSNSGTGNTMGLVATYVSEIGKNGTQASAVTAELSSNGGEIR